MDSDASAFARGGSYGACGVPVVLPRARISREEIAYALEKRRLVRASWGAVAKMLGRCEADVREACSAAEAAISEADVEAEPAQIEPTADPEPDIVEELPVAVQQPAQRQLRAQVRRGSYDHLILTALREHTFTRCRLANHMHASGAYLAARLAYLRQRCLISEEGPHPALLRLTLSGRELVDDLAQR